ncbi:hypothetical protein SDC9_132960 [bioreactor metagenome]|uniref:Uncharacterized protein n=1 Tax=bioreactor metagenome TaxID=1076179 RepID=A0A645D9L0_9ZZZZ
MPAVLAPTSLHQAMHQYNIYIPGAELLAVTVQGFLYRNVFVRSVFIRPDLCQQGDFFTGEVFYCFTDIRVRSVRVGHIEEPDTSLVGMVSYLDKFLHT